MASDPKLRQLAFVVAALALVGVFVWGKLRPHPQTGRPFALNATSLEGTQLTTASFQGKPWVINLWRPG